MDLFRLNIPDTGTLFVATDTADFTGGYCDTFVRIFRLESNGAITDLASNDDGSAPGDATGHVTDSYAAVTVTRGEAVYVGVSDQANRPYDPGSAGGRNTSGAGGFYDLLISFANNDLNGTIPTAVNATLPTGSLQGIIGADGSSGNVVGDRDVDIFHLRSGTSGVIDVAVDSDGRSDIATPMDTVLTLFDAAGTVLSVNDDFDGLDPRLQFLAQADTDYYVAVSGYGNQNFDPFVLASGTSGATGDYCVSARSVRQRDGGADGQLDPERHAHADRFRSDSLRQRRGRRGVLRRCQ